MIKNAFYIKNFPFEHKEIYIEKDRLYLSKTYLMEQLQKKESTSDNVNDAIFVEPGISQYTLKWE